MLNDRFTKNKENMFALYQTSVPKPLNIIEIDPFNEKYTQNFSIFFSNSGFLIQFMPHFLSTICIQHSSNFLFFLLNLLLFLHISLFLL